MRKKYLIGISACVICTIIAFGFWMKAASGPPSIRIGYFHGGRTLMLYRAMVTGYYDQEQVDINLITKMLHKNTWLPVPKKVKDLAATPVFRSFGKATGNELVDLMLEGKVDGATIGETAFVLAAAAGKPIVAVAELGRDVQGKAGHAIVVKSGMEPKGPEDLKKMTWGSRRSSGGDTVILREFLHVEGVNPDEVKMITDIADDRQSEMLRDGEIHGGYFHLMMIPRIVKEGWGYVYRKLDWIDPEMSQSVLVFTRKYAQENGEAIKRLLRAYMKRIAFEHSLPELSRTRKRRNKGMEMAWNYQGMNLPQYRKVPEIRRDIIEKAEDLLLRHRQINNKIDDIDKYYNNSFVQEVGSELYPPSNETK